MKNHQKYSWYRPGLANRGHQQKWLKYEFQRQSGSGWWWLFWLLQGQYGLLGRSLHLARVLLTRTQQPTHSRKETRRFCHRLGILACNWLGSGKSWRRCGRLSGIQTWQLVSCCTCCPGAGRIQPRVAEQQRAWPRRRRSWCHSSVRCHPSRVPRNMKKYHLIIAHV